MLAPIRPLCGPIAISDALAQAGITVFDLYHAYSNLKTREGELSLRTPRGHAAKRELEAQIAALSTAGTHFLNALTAATGTTADEIRQNGLYWLYACLTYNPLNPNTDTAT